MQESYIEGLASHDDLEGCAGDREVAGEAFSEVRAGWVSSRENTPLGCRRRPLQAEGNTNWCAKASTGSTLRGQRPHACSETPCTEAGRSTALPRVAPWDAKAKAKAGGLR
jgi:hypothetical protein